MRLKDFDLHMDAIRLFGPSSILGMSEPQFRLTEPCNRP